MSSTPPTKTIIRKDLPSGDSIVFWDSTFFRNNGKGAELPTPAAVRTEAVKAKKGPWAIKPYSVPFSSLGLVVKHGTHITVAEAQCLWAIRQRLGPRVPVPELYGWCTEGGEVFIYMELIQGTTLSDAIEKKKLKQKDLQHIASQLRDVVLALRSLRQEPEETFLGVFSSKPDLTVSVF